MVDALRLSTLQPLRILDGMAHDFPLPLIDTFADAIAGIARRGTPR